MTAFRNACMVPTFIQSAWRQHKGRWKHKLQCLGLVADDAALRLLIKPVSKECLEQEKESSRT